MGHSALLALADGSLFYGDSIGVDGAAVGEVVFNTSITGYQEILTDPSYCRQIITFTQPQIGNVGVNSEDTESPRVYASGMIIKQAPYLPSNWRNEQSLTDYLAANQVVAIANIDTRRLTRLLRDKGAQDGCIIAGERLEEARALALAGEFPGLKGMDLAREVTTTQNYNWQESVWSLEQGYGQAGGARKRKVVAMDFGMKKNILRILYDLGCELEVVPATTTAEEILSRSPDGVFLSNGPGDPEPCDYAINAIRDIVAASVPTFGICLGHQLLGLACGADTVKMKFGHHGGNHPVQELATGKVMITSQNHGFTIAEEPIPETLSVTHRSLFDGTVQGIHHREQPAFGFQGHPEASPGPHDIKPLFDHFMHLMGERK
ncbi:MAG: glutamine-hydrolyzing carbamoyl-phosphate synthase small subunit [Gammaproteobacteria bacterium]|nr:glutamine-hydrolyzing carbamoyl-phosphate synthase small subunit [Gammaproteobacteria bacterium]